MQNNENINKASLSSWNYGAFSCINPYYSQRNIKNENKQNNIRSKTCKGKIVKNEYFENIPFEIYINRDINYHDEFVLKLKEKNEENYIMLKKNGKTFEKWEKIKLEEKKNEEIKKEKEIKALKEEKIKKMKERIEENKKKLNEFIEKRKKRIKKENKIGDKNKELLKKKKIKEKNKTEFINFCVIKSIEKRNNKLKDNFDKNNQKIKYERKQMDEIIGPFHFAKNMREAQKNYYKNINKTNNSNISKRSNTAKK